MPVIKEIQNYIKKRSGKINYKDNYKPDFFRLSDEEDAARLHELINVDQGIEVKDTLEGQLRELIKIRNPQQKPDEDTVQAEIKSLLGDKNIEEYGLWVYYPWQNCLIHILDEEEFIELRTARNIYKISPEERTVLRSKKIGVIGLSVGQSIALTLAMERVCGEIRLADFDEIELSNLNRLRVGLHNLGINKAIAAAREIAEIDPFIKVKCFTDGATEDNIDEFLTDGGQLDILVEECDSVEVKILGRIKAKAYGIPVVMDTNDKGMIDVERYDLTPDIPLLHGRINNNIDMETLKKMPHPEKINLILKMVDVDNLSERMQLSLQEIGKTISTWPQLASAVMLGGAAVTEVCRRILLNQFTSSGRYYINLEEIIA